MRSSRLCKPNGNAKVPAIIRRPLPQAGRFGRLKVKQTFGDVPIDVERSNDRNFAYFDIDNPNLFELSDAYSIAQESVKMKLSDLINVVQGSSSDDAFTTTRPMRMENMRRLRTHFDPSDLRVSSEEFETCHPPEVNIWIGGPGKVRTSTHFDALHNFFVQLHGQKTFVLHPPCASSALKLFPHLHPQVENQKLRYGFQTQNYFPLQCG